MGLSVLRLAGGAVHGSESHAGAAVARRSSANPRAACARLLHSIRERERDGHQSERCGYPFGAADPASRLLPCPLAASALIMTSIAAGQAETLRLNVGDVIGSERYDRGPVSSVAHYLRTAKVGRLSFADGEPCLCNR